MRSVFQIRSDQKEDFMSEYDSLKLTYPKVNIKWDRISLSTYQLIVSGNEAQVIDFVRESNYLVKICKKGDNC